MFMELSERRGELVLHWLIRSWEAPFGELEEHGVITSKNSRYPIGGWTRHRQEG